MARPSPASPLSYLVKRQYYDQFHINKQLLKERLNTARNLYRKDLLAHYGCVNAIEFSNKGELLASGGDDRRVLIWNVEQAVHGVGKPTAMRAQHISNIFCLGFDSTNSKVFSAGNDDQVIVHDAKTGDPLDYFLHEQPVYGLSIDPLNDNVFASACDDGRVLIFDIREPAGTDPFCLASYTSAFHAVMFNPVEPRILTTANSKEGVGLWDIRQPRQVVMRYGGQSPAQSCMSVRFNGRGTQILALRRRLPPILYSVHHSQHLSQFDHAGYYNSCTMKSCCFAGEDDQYVLSGSDDFNLYVWKIPDSDDKGQWVDSAHMILRGHRSIVNQVRFNSSNYIVASSGVEKLIKFWSPFPLPESTGGLECEPEPLDKQRRVFSHEEYISLVLRSGQFMSHDYSHQSTKEDPRMMAFFDSLVQREIEGWSSEDSYSSEISAVGIRTAVEEALPAPSHSDSESSLAAGQVSDLQALAAAYVEALEGQVNNSSTAEQTNTEVEPAQVNNTSTSTTITSSSSITTTTATTTSTTGTTSEAQNRISQLIARKRAQLMRFARTRQGQSEAADEGKQNRAAHTDTNETPRRINGKSGSRSSHSCNTNSRKNRTRYMLEWIETSDDDTNCRTSTRQKRKRLWEKHSSGSTSSSNSDNESNTATCKRQRRMRKHKGNKKTRRVAESDSSDSSSSDDSTSSWQDSQNKKNVDNVSRGIVLYSSSTSSSDGDGCHKKIALRRKRQLRQHKSSSRNTKVPTTTDNTAKKKKNNNNTEALDNSTVQVSQNGKTDYIGLAYSSDSSTDVEGEVNKSLEVATTPLGPKSRSLAETPDSGIIVAPCTSSTGSIESRPGSSGANHVSDNDPEYVFKRCKNRLDRARRNYRNRIGDSDSN